MIYLPKEREPNKKLNAFNLIWIQKQAFPLVSLAVRFAEVFKKPKCDSGIQLAQNKRTKLCMSVLLLVSPELSGLESAWLEFSGQKLLSRNLRGQNSPGLEFALPEFAKPYLTRQV